jgi:hypothetical protein
MKVLRYNIAIPIRVNVLIELELVGNRNLPCFLNLKLVSAGVAIGSKTQPEIHCFYRFGSMLPLPLLSLFKCIYAWHPFECIYTRLRHGVVPMLCLNGTLLQITPL